jgi:hypothetical protein
MDHIERAAQNLEDARDTTRFPIARLMFLSLIAEEARAAERELPHPDGTVTMEAGAE